MDLEFLPSKNDLPRLGDAERSALGFEHWKESLSRLSDRELHGFAEKLSDDPAGRHLLEVVFSNSGFLTNCVLTDLGFFAKLLKLGPEKCLGEILDSLRNRTALSRDPEQAAAELRRAKRRAALVIGLSDLAGHWDLPQVCEALSDFADGALDAAISHLLLHAAERGDLELNDPENPLKDCGYAVLAMGKLGARELNYSSEDRKSVV